MIIAAIATSSQKIPAPLNSKMDLSIDRFLNLVELTGIEPVASWLQTRRSPS